MQRDWREIFRAAVQIHCADIVANCTVDDKSRAVREAIKIDDAIRAAMQKEAQRVPKLQPRRDDPSLPQRAVGELGGVAVCDATRDGGAA